jgi:hypothetical protein
MLARAFWFCVRCFGIIILPWFVLLLCGVPTPQAGRGRPRNFVIFCLVFPDLTEELGLGPSTNAAGKMCVRNN